MNIKYIIYNPAGNITALVIGDKYSVEERKIINKFIMEKETEVEQVGFLSEENIRLTMAGGEFCGNATRCAVLYYIKKKSKGRTYVCPKEITINNNKLKVGINKGQKIWCEIPIEDYKIIKIDKKIYQIVFQGITIIALEKNLKDLKKTAKEIIKKYKIDDDAIGVMFIERIEEYINIYPVVWVKAIDTLFLENACGSGTIAVTMLETWLTKKSNKYKVQQPSGEFLETNITIKNNKITKAILSGKIVTDNKIREINIIGGSYERI